MEGMFEVDDGVVGPGRTKRVLSSEVRFKTMQDCYYMSCGYCRKPIMLSVAAHVQGSEF